MSENSTTNVPETMSFPENKILEKTVVDDNITMIKKVVTLYMCNHCEMEFSSPESVTYHANITHNPLINCKYCQKNMRSVSYYRHFKKFHQNGENFQCECNRLFVKKEDLDRHIVKCHIVNSSPND